MGADMAASAPHDSTKVRSLFDKDRNPERLGHIEPSTPGSCLAVLDRETTTSRTPFYNKVTTDSSSVIN